MTNRHLKIFITVYQTQNITRAAERLFMTQPAVTRAIQELERHYGLCLFERVNKRIYVTEAGKQLYSHALHIIDSFEQMETKMRDWNGIGVLRIGATPTLGSVLLPQTLKEFRGLFPELTVKMMINNGDTLEKAIEYNGLDFAVIEGMSNAQNLHREFIGEDRLVLILPPGDERSHAESLNIVDLSDAQFLLLEKGSTSRAMLEHIFALRGITVEPTMESVSTHAVVQAVHIGLGISFLPEKLVWHSIESGFVSTRKVDDEAFVRRNYLVWHENKYMSESAKTLLALCRKYAK